MGAIQPWHLILLLIIVLIVLGPGKLPEVGKSLGESIREFRKATTETRDAISLQPPAQPPVAAPPAPPAAPIAAPPVAPVADAPREAEGSEVQRPQ